MKRTYEYAVVIVDLFAVGVMSFAMIGEWMRNSTEALPRIHGAPIGVSLTTAVCVIAIAVGQMVRALSSIKDRENESR